MTEGTEGVPEILFISLGSICDPPAYFEVRRARVSLSA